MIITIMQNELIRSFIGKNFVFLIIVVVNTCINRTFCIDLK